MHIFNVYKNGVFVKRMDVHGIFDALNGLQDWALPGEPPDYWFPCVDKDRTKPLARPSSCDLGYIIDGDEYTVFRIGFTGWDMNPSQQQ